MSQISDLDVEEMGYKKAIECFGGPIDHFFENQLIAWPIESGLLVGRVLEFCDNGQTAKTRIITGILPNGKRNRCRSVFPKDECEMNMVKARKAEHELKWFQQSIKEKCFPPSTEPLDQ
jgi:hypothetical protein